MTYSCVSVRMYVRLTSFPLLAVSENLVRLLQERHDLREQITMRKIAVEQLLRCQTTSDLNADDKDIESSSDADDDDGDEQTLSSSSDDVMQRLTSTPDVGVQNGKGEVAENAVGDNHCLPIDTEEPDDGEIR